MSEPRTEAGRALLDDLRYGRWEFAPRDIRAIEDEAAALAAQPESAGHLPECNRDDDHERDGCEVSWAELGESFSASLAPESAGLDVERLAVAARLASEGTQVAMSLPDARSFARWQAREYARLTAEKP